MKYYYYVFVLLFKFVLSGRDVATSIHVSEWKLDD